MTSLISTKRDTAMPQYALRSATPVAAAAAASASGIAVAGVGLWLLASTLTAPSTPPRIELTSTQMTCSAVWSCSDSGAVASRIGTTPMASQVIGAGPVLGLFGNGVDANALTCGTNCAGGAGGL